MRRFTDAEMCVISENHTLMSYKDIGALINRSEDVIKHKAASMGLVEYRAGTNPRSRKKRKYYVNDDFFKIPNMLNSYWGGFIAADGYIRCINRDNISLSIMLSTKDLSHLQSLCVDMNTNKPIHMGTSNEKPVCSLTIASKQICEDLEINYNIIPRKSLVLEPPSLHNKEMIDSYIRGYIDGDGSVTRAENRPRFSILSTLAMCDWMRSRIVEIIGRQKGIYIYKKQKQHSLIIAGISGTLLYEYFISINGRCLERKWNL